MDNLHKKIREIGIGIQALNNQIIFDAKQPACVARMLWSRARGSEVGCPMQSSPLTTYQLFVRHL